MRIAIVGFGGVGKAFLKLLLDKRQELLIEGIEPKVKYIISSRGGIYNPKGIDILDLIDFLGTNRDITQYIYGGSKDIKFENIIDRDDVDMVIEMTPTNKITGEPGMTHILKSLKNGYDVITANKGPIMLAYKNLSQVAHENNVQLGIGCTTGGALPSINGGVIDLAGSKIISIEGVLNGTTNFILNEMESTGNEYSAALKTAQESGIAETDPTLDVEGWDTATKLLILSNVLMDGEKTLEDINVEGITTIKASDIEEAAKLGLKYKLVGKTVRKEDSIEMTVKLMRLSPDNPLFGVDGKNKAVRYTSDTLGDLTIIGGASGVVPAAASILRDLINIKRGYKYIR